MRVTSLILLLAVAAQAHNWVWSASRAPQAAVASPCMTRINSDPHIQVGRDQTFYLEWSTGHSGPNQRNPNFMYFVLVAEKDVPRLATLTDDLIEKYLNTRNLITGDKWKKKHMAGKNINGLGYMDRTTGGSDYITLDPNQKLKSLWSQDNPTSYQYKYRTPAVANDKRASYYNSDPALNFIISADRFEIVFKKDGEHPKFAFNSDLANFAVPARVKNNGAYVYWMSWRGYKDCVDIDLQPSRVSYPYGRASTAASTQYPFVRVDHCYVTRVGKAHGGMDCKKHTAGIVAPTLERCKRETWCTAVQVAPVTNPSGTRGYTPNIPYTVFDNKDTKCKSPIIHERNKAGCTRMVGGDCPATFGRNDMVIYGMRPRIDPQSQVGDIYRTTTDPRDPAFYGTCYFQVDKGGFLAPAVKPAAPPLVWDAGEKCLKCDFVKNLAKQPVQADAPDWRNAFQADGQCRNCRLAK